MNSGYEPLYCKWILVIVVFVISRAIIYTVLPWLHKLVRAFINGVSIPEIESTEQIKLDEVKRSIEEAKIQALLVELRDKKLIWITISVGVVEVLIFSFVSAFLLTSNELSVTNSDKLKYFGAFLGGWLGLKVLSRHGPWSNYIAGKAYYHISLMATLFNIGSGVLMAIIYTYL